MSENVSQLMTVKDVAVTLNMGRATVWRLVKNGQLPKPIKIGNSTRWRRADIEAIYSNDVA